MTDLTDETKTSKSTYLLEIFLSPRKKVNLNLLHDPIKFTDGKHELTVGWKPEILGLLMESVLFVIIHHI